MAVGGLRDVGLQEGDSLRAGLVPEFAGIVGVESTSSASGSQPGSDAPRRGCTPSYPLPPSRHSSRFLIPKKTYSAFESILGRSIVAPHYFDPSLVLFLLTPHFTLPPSDPPSCPALPRLSLFLSRMASK